MLIIQQFILSIPHYSAFYDDITSNALKQTTYKTRLKYSINNLLNSSTNPLKSHSLIYVTQHNMLGKKTHNNN